MAGEYDKLIRNLNSLITDDRIARTALSSVLPIHKKRIFESGQDGNNAKIGTYSTKPISIAKKNQSRQTGHTYFKGGYAQYKSEVGKNPGFVNLRNTDQMQMDYGLMTLGQEEFGFGFTNSENFNKTQWNEEKYKKSIFVLTQQEQDTLQKLIEQQIAKRLESNS